jgi:hypothetical protein
MAAGPAMAAGSALPAAITAGGIEEGRAADHVDRRVDQVSAGGRRGGQRSHCRSKKHTGDRTESGHTTAICRHVARVAVSLSVAVTSHFPAHIDYAHNLSSWAIWVLRSCRIGS